MTRETREWSGLLLAAAIVAGAWRPAQAQAPAGAAAPRAVQDSIAGARRDDVPTGVAEPESLTLAVALSFALAHNPSLAAWPAELRALDAEAGRASRRPNPQAGALVENIATDQLETTLHISQLVELGGKRSRRLAVAQADRELAGWAFESARADVVGLAARCFVDALAAQQRVAIRRELVRLAQEALTAVSARVRAGGASAVEETRAQLAVETARVELTSMERERTLAYRRLAGVWGSRTPRFSAVRGDLERVTPTAPLDTLLARIDRNPDVARWATEIAWRESAEAAARALRVPDLTLEAGLRRLDATRETGFLVGVGIPLPVFDRGRDAMSAADFRSQGAREQRQAARLEATIRLGIAHEETAAGLAEYRQLKDDLLPGARNAHAAASAAFRSGLLRLTDVLDVQRSLFEAAMRTVDALVRYHTAAFEIERLTGLPADASNIKEQE